jgi:hypothetical protein
MTMGGEPLKARTLESEHKQVDLEEQLPDKPIPLNH